MLFLPVAPDIDDPDEGGAGVPGTSWGALSASGVLGGGAGNGDLGGPGDNSGVESGSKKRLTHSSSTSDSKRKRLEEVNISLPNAPTDSEHPLLNPKMEKPQKLPSTKQSSGNGGGGRGRPRLNDDGGSSGSGGGGGGGSRKRKEKY